MTYCPWQLMVSLTETLMLTYIQLFSCPRQLNIVTLSPTAWLISWVTDLYSLKLGPIQRCPTNCDLSNNWSDWVGEDSIRPKKTNTFPHTETKTKTLKIRNLSTIFKLYTSRDEICQCRHCWRQCKIFASSVNFSRNNAIYNINESTKYTLPWYHL